MQRIVLFLAFACLILLIKAPPYLVTSNAYRIKYSINGTERHDGKVYRTLFFDSKTYLLLPHADFSVFPFISIDWNAHKAILPPIYEDSLFGWHHVSYVASGLALDDPDLKDYQWRINFRSDGVDLSDQASPLSHQQLKIEVNKN